MRSLGFLVFAWVWLWLSPLSTILAAEGPLFIAGGGLRPDNIAAYRRLLAIAGGATRCRFAVFPAASKELGGAERVARTLILHGVPADQVSVIDIRPENAERTAHDPAIADQIRRCNAVFFAGGDQSRIVAAFRRRDGSATPALDAVREVWQRGGVVAGTSAGAAMQSQIMIAVSGLPDEALDDGMDALDFGLTAKPNQRGLFVTAGLGFLQDGIIDQHFNQFRGRLGRLARATIEQKVKYGLGIDENTAIIVLPQGRIEVVGEGCLTVLDVSAAKCLDGPLGCHIQGLRLSCLQTGDQVDLRTGKLTVHAGKTLITPEKETIRGNRLITDIAAEGAVPFALFTGLAENTSHTQTGINLRYTHSFGHGYRYTFQKTEQSRCWGGYVGDVYANAVQDIEVCLESIVSSLQPAGEERPFDIPEGVAGTACEALWFRGILLPDRQGKFRPDAALTRGELAIALAHSAHLLPPPGRPPRIRDIPESSHLSHDVTEVVEAKLMELDESGAFRPQEVVSRQEAAFALGRLHLALHGAQPGKPVVLDDESEIQPFRRPKVFAAIQAGLLQVEKGRFRPAEALSRREAAQALFQILGFSWSKSE